MSALKLTLKTNKKINKTYFNVFLQLPFIFSPVHILLHTAVRKTEAVFWGTDHKDWDRKPRTGTN